MNKLFVTLTLVALLFLGFVVGATVMRFELFPYAYLKDSFVNEVATVVFAERFSPESLPFLQEP